LGRHSGESRNPEILPELFEKLREMLRKFTPGPNILDTILAKVRTMPPPKALPSTLQACQKKMSKYLTKIELLENADPNPL